MELLIKKHVRFMERHIGLLPSSQEKNDANRLAIVYYSLVGICCLDAEALTAHREGASASVIQLYRQSELSDGTVVGGFLGSRTMEVSGRPTMSSANTLFATLSLLCLEAHEFLQCKENSAAICEFVSRCQLPDGSFVSMLDIGGGGCPSPTDSHDLRFCYIAVALLYLHGCRTPAEYARYVDVEQLVDYVLTQRCIGGAFGAFGEAHAGYTSCALSLLSILGKLDSLDEEFRARTVSWLVHRQVSAIGAVPLQDDNEQFYAEDHGGFQGRENKAADTCYAFWCMNSLEILEASSLVDNGPMESYLLQQTQNSLVGGFAKTDEDDPDIYHTFLGIAALGLIAGTFDGALCVPKNVSAQWVRSTTH
ncbi:AaceriAGR384Cp [[Ashbya] aceris (nom. inval.)]|nr:AaceriAGR384Cp [[Ashbya] aceris (nom. inval.)]